jgi:transcriptional regulator with XRE-family HTH domain
MAFQVILAKIFVPDEFMSIGERLREERERLKLSQTAFGEIDGVGKNTVISWEKNHSSPTAVFLERAASRGVDTDYVITGNRGISAAGMRGHVFQAPLRLSRGAAAYEVARKRARRERSEGVPVFREGEFSEGVNFSSRFGGRILEERQRLGLSQDALAALCGVSREMWGKYERGISVMGADVLYAFALSGGNALYALTGLRHENIAVNGTELAYLGSCRSFPNHDARQAGLDMLDLLIKAYGMK